MMELDKERGKLASIETRLQGIHPFFEDTTSEARRPLKYFVDSFILLSRGAEVEWIITAGYELTKR